MSPRIREDFEADRDEDGDYILTLEEEQAIERVQKAFRRWPKKLMVASMGGSLVIIPTDHRMGYGGEGIDQEDVLAEIPNVPNTGGDW